MIITKTSQGKKTGTKTTKEFPVSSMSEAIEKINELARETKTNNPNSKIKRQGETWIQVETKNILITYEVWGEWNLCNN